jgi:histidine triad (HIT) family protein
MLPKHMEVEGHALIIPKQHFQDIFDIPGEVLGEVMEMTRDVSRILRDRLNVDGINMFHASGKAAQQSVGHFHIHIIPRFDGDNLDTWPDLPGCSASHQEFLHLINGKNHTVDEGSRNG